MLAISHRAFRGGNHAFDEAGVVVLVVAGQAVAHLVEFEFRQQGDTVEGFLPMDGDVIAEPLEFHARKCVVNAFCLLQADDVRLALGKPGQRRVDALLDRIDVPGGDAHEKI